MISRQRLLGVMVTMALTFALVLGLGFTGIAKAASEDVAMFYDDLSQYGEWVDMENYGAVWRPTKVSEDWRPYTDGRWVPTNDGNVFESQEPWGWATYHYGNWMPTANGWVWVPGRTWYPSTVEWRTSPETEPVDTSYVGWAPTPPQNYVPEPAYAPADYYQGSPGMDSMSSPLWIFARAAQFLLGSGQPYNSNYSYMNSGYLMSPDYVPVFYDQTQYYPSYASPSYYPASYFGGQQIGQGYYSMGPSARYISRVTNINQTIINQTIVQNSNNISRLNGVLPPSGVIDRRAYLKQIIPPALVQGQRLPAVTPVKNFKMARANLNKPNLVPAPKNVPAVTATIPRAQAGAVQPGRALPGTTLPAKAVMPLTPQMTQQIQKLPPQQRLGPAKATQPGPAQPGTPPQVAPTGVPGKAGPGPAQPGTPPQVAPTGVPGKAGPGQAIVPGQPRQVQPGTAPAGQVKPGEFRPGTRPSGAVPGVTTTTPTAPGAVKPSGVPQVTPGAQPQVQPKHEPQVQPKHEPQVQPKPQPQVQPRHEPQPQPQVTPKHEPQVQPKPQPQVQPRHEPQPQPQPRPQPQVQPRPQPQPQHQAPARVQPQPAPQPRPQPQVAPRPQPAPQPRPQPQAAPRPQPAPQPAKAAPQPAKAAPQPAKKEEPKKPGQP